MASQQYLQAIKGMRQLQQQRVSQAMGVSGNYPGIQGSGRIQMEMPKARQQMGLQSPLLVASKAAAPVIAGLAVIGGAAYSSYKSNVGIFTGNDAAANRARNQSEYISTATSIAGGIAGVATAGTAGAAISTATGGAISAGLGTAIAGVAAVAVLASTALKLAEDARKLSFQIQERQAQAAKDQQRLGYIAAARGR